MANKLLEDWNLQFKKTIDLQEKKYEDIVNEAKDNPFEIKFKKQVENKEVGKTYEEIVDELEKFGPAKIIDEANEILAKSLADNIFTDSNTFIDYFKSNPKALSNYPVSKENYDKTLKTQQGQEAIAQKKTPLTYEEAAGLPKENIFTDKKTFKEYSQSKDPKRIDDYPISKENWDKNLSTSKKITEPGDTEKKPDSFKEASDKRNDLGKTENVNIYTDKRTETFEAFSKDYIAPNSTKLDNYPISKENWDVMDKTQKTNSKNARLTYESEVNRPKDNIYSESNPAIKKSNILEQVWDWLEVITREMGSGKANLGGDIITFNLPKWASFTLSQTLLYAMNPQLGKGQIYIPFNYYAAAFPLFRGNIPTTFDVALREVASGLSEWFPNQTVSIPDFPSVHRVESVPKSEDNIYGTKKRIATSIDPTGLVKKAKDIMARVSAFSAGYKPTGYHDLKDTIIMEDGSSSEAVLARKRANTVDVAVTKKDYRAGGIIPVENNNDARHKLLEELYRNLYIIFFFKDLRTYPMQGKSYNNYLVLRAFIDTIGENFAPSITSEGYYGRTDPIMISDTNVTRTINCNFKIVCFSPQDVKIAYQKLNWLTSMVYSEYQNERVYRSPIIEMRVGDLICDIDGNGIPGKLTSLSWDYAGAMWEIDGPKTDIPGSETESRQVPLLINITTSFQAFHRKQIKVERGMFMDDYLRGFGATTLHEQLLTDLKFGNLETTFGNVKTQKPSLGVGGIKPTFLKGY